MGYHITLHSSYSCVGPALSTGTPTEGDGSVPPFDLASTLSASHSGSRPRFIGYSHGSKGKEREMAWEPEKSRYGIVLCSDTPSTPCMHLGEGTKCPAVKWPRCGSSFTSSTSRVSVCYRGERWRTRSRRWPSASDLSRCSGIPMAPVSSVLGAVCQVIVYSILSMILPWFSSIICKPCICVHVCLVYIPFKNILRQRYGL